MVLMDNSYFIYWKGATNKKYIFSVLKHFLSWSFVKIVAIFGIEIIKKGAHLHFAMGSILHRYATDQDSLDINVWKRPEAAAMKKESPEQHSWKPRAPELEPCSWKEELQCQSCVIFPTAPHPWNKPHCGRAQTIQSKNSRDKLL